MSAQKQSAPTFAGALNREDQFARLTYLSNAFLMTSETVSLRSLALSRAAAQRLSGIRMARGVSDGTWYLNLSSVPHYPNAAFTIKAAITVISVIIPRLNSERVSRSKPAIKAGCANTFLVFNVLHCYSLVGVCIYRIHLPVYTPQAHFKNTFGRVA